MRFYGLIMFWNKFRIHKTSKFGLFVNEIKPIKFRFTIAKFRSYLWAGRNAWAGLGKTSSNSYGTTLIDDAPKNKEWFCAIGATAYWPERLKIPGPKYEKEEGGPEGGISEVILYVFK